MINRIRSALAAPVYEDEDRTRVARVLNTILLSILVLNLAVYPATALANLFSGQGIVAPTPIVIVGLLLFPTLYFFFRRGYVRSVSILTVMVLLGVVTYSITTSGGLLSPIVTGYAATIILSAILLGPRATVYVAASVMVIIWTVQFLVDNRVLVVSPLDLSTPVWLSYTAIFAVMAIMVRLAAQSINDSLDRARSNERSLLEANRQMHALGESLEQRVSERTNQLAVSSEVSRALTRILDPNELIRQLVQLIMERFDYYYVAVFLMDEDEKFAVLREATGVAGRTLKERGHKLELGGQSMVGTAIALRAPRISGEVEHERLRFDNPLLPETRSEIALPLIVSDNVLGALNVQSKQANAFDDSTVSLLLGMADQIAIALNNARAFQYAQLQARKATALFEASRFAGFIGEDLQTVTRQMLVTVAVQADFSIWYVATYDEVQATFTMLGGYDLDPGNIGEWPTSELEARTPLMVAARSQQTIIINDPATDPHLTAWSVERRSQQGKSVSMPIMLGERLLGAIRLGRKLEQANIEANDVQVAQALATQLAATFENHHLFSQSQKATRELDELMKRYTREGWSRFQESAGEAGRALYEFSQPGTKALDGQALARIEQAAYLNDPTPMVLNGNSAIGVPIALRGEIIGTLGVQDNADRQWNEDELAMLRAVADQVAQSVEVARLLDETESSLQEATQLYQSSRSMAASTTPAEVMQIVVSKIQQWLDVDQVRLILFDEDKGFGSVAAEAVPSPNVDALRIPMTGNPSYEELARTLRSIAIYDVANDPLTTAIANMLRAYGVRSTLLLPLVVGQRMIGSISADVTRQYRKFSEKEISFCETLAGQAAVAIENRRLFQETQRRAEIEATLNKISQSIRASLDPQAVLDMQATIAEMGSLLQCSRSFYLTNEDDQRFVRAYEWAAPGVASYVGTTGWWSSLQWTYEMLKSGQIIVTEKVERDDPPELRADMRARRVLSHMQVPMLTGNRLVGVLGFEQVDYERRWSQEEINIVRRVGDQLAAALENARLYDNVRQRVNELTVLTRIGRRLASTLDLDEVLSLIVAEAITATRAERGSVALYNEVEDALEVAHMRGYNPEVETQMMGTFLRKGNGLFGRMLTTREAVLVGDVYLEYDYKQIGNTPTRSEYIIPIRQGDTLLGALNLESSIANAFSEADVRLMEALADQAAVAIVNARAYQAERSALERMREVDRLKTEFLANMSHELRTPLNSIIGFSRVILRGIDGPLTDLQVADLTAIHNSGQHLLGLINNILDLSKIEAGKLELSIEEIDLHDIVKVVMSTAIALVKDKNVQLRQELPETLSVVKADVTRVRQILLNLVSNAAKFTEHGSITVRVESLDKELIVSVTDTGIGIPEDKLDQIFEEFTQVDASTTRRVGGTGLGLAITRRFVELHGGRIWVESQVEVGSTFYFTLPLEPIVEGEVAPVRPAQPVAQSPRPRDASSGQDRRLILSIDDDPGVITLYRRYLEKQGFRVVGLTDSSKAVDEALRLRPFAITLDVLMPARDGWSVLADLKSSPQTSNIPILVCSIIKDESKAFSLGAADYLIKPITEDELLRALDHIEHVEAEQAVLVIDDEPDARRLIRRLLEDHPGYNVTEAAGGALGIAAVQTEPPDLIILDLMMPEVDGFAVLEYLKSNVRTRDIPVLIVTAKDLTEEDQERLRGKTIALLNKGSFGPEQLLDEIAHVLQHISEEGAHKAGVTHIVGGKAQTAPGS